MTPDLCAILRHEPCRHIVLDYAVSRDELAEFSDRLDDEYYEVLSNGSWLESKVSEGGTSSARVSEQLGRARQILEGVTP